MSAHPIVHVIGTGTIGEPLIGLLAGLKDDLGIEEVTFHKRTPLLTDRSKVVSLIHRGAKLCTDAGAVKGFQELGMEPTYEAVEAIRRAAVVIDCTPSGIGTQNKTEYYEKFTSNTLGFIAQGSEFGFGKPYARGINDAALIKGQDQYLQIVSCNTHNLSILIQALALADGGPKNLTEGRFVCMRRANDISQDGSFVPSPQVGRHKDPRFGTHHARDAWHLYNTLDYNLNLFSTALKLNSQYMHTIFFDIRVDKPTTVEKLVENINGNDRMALSRRRTATRCSPRSPRRHGSSTPTTTRNVSSASRDSSTTRSRKERGHSVFSFSSYVPCQALKEKAECPRTSLAFEFADGFGDRREDLEEVTDDAVVGDLEDRRVGVLVDRHDHLGRGHARQVLDRPGDADREVEARRHDLARLAHLMRVGDPAGVDDGA
jgi:glyceraldehyde-3-phosphate dehydrogenase (NAD(P))